MDTNTIFETNECKLNMLSDSWTKTIVIYISCEQFGDLGQVIRNIVEDAVGSPLTFCELLVKEWDKYLTPWRVDINMKGRVFEGRAEELLSILKTQIVSKINEHINNARIYIAGYSLAGLFALWSLYEADLFDGAACCSGSVWYPGWLDYVSQHKIKQEGCIYLSLGKKEKNTKHPVMKKVEDNMVQQYEILKNDVHVQKVKMDWNEGGHFNKTAERIEKGIIWLVMN